MAILNGFLLLAMIDAGRGLARCIGDVSDGNENGHQRMYIKSPNYKNESGKAASCEWTIEVPSSEYLTLHVIDFRLHYKDKGGNVYCAPAYNLTINGKRLGCDPARTVNASAPSGKTQNFCIQVRNSNCVPKNECLIREIVDKKLVITYNANGSRIPKDSTPLMNGFRILYYTNDCEKPEQANSSTSTKSDEATSSTSPLLSFSNTDVAMTTNSSGTIATTAMASSTAGVVTMTSPFANVNWMILGVAFAGGALMVLVVGLCCGIATRKKRSQDKRPALTQVDSNSNEVLASQPDRSVESSSLPQFSDNKEATPTPLDQSSLHDSASTNSQVTPTSVDQSSLHEYASVGRPTLVSQSGPDIYASVTTTGANKKTTVHYKKENVTNTLYWDTP